MKSRLTYLTVLACIISAFSVAVTYGSNANAAEASSTDENILLSPTKKRYQLEAGETKRDTIKIVNSGEVPISFIVYARPYSVINENYDPNYDSNFKNADIYKWVQFDTGSYKLSGGESVDIPYTVRVPQNAAPGGHYGVLFAETQVTAQPSGTAILQKKRLGAIVYATVKGETQLNGKFLGVDVPFFQTKAPLVIRERLQNSGNTDFVVKSTTSVSDIFGGLKYKNQKESAVLPDTTRMITNDWTNPAWMGFYRVEQRAEYLDTSKTTTNYVLFVPLWVYLTAGLLIAGRILYALKGKRRSKK